jgi:hypothetical protein
MANTQPQPSARQRPRTGDPVRNFGYPPGWIPGDRRGIDPQRALVDMVGALVAETQDQSAALVDAVRAIGISPLVNDTEGFPANIVDALDKVAWAIGKLALAYEDRTALQFPDSARSRERDTLTPLWADFTEPDRGRATGPER